MLVLIVEPNAREAKSLAESVREKGSTPFITDTLKSAAAVLQKEKVNLVLLNLNGNKQTVEKFLEANQARDEAPPIILMAERAGADEATRLMGMGAHDFWIKPIEQQRLAKTIELLDTGSSPASTPGHQETRPIIARNSRMLELKAMAERVAATGAPVLIQGESGTGKELFARHIHEHSSRRDKPFIAVNCAALPEGLLESELFGYERGAFTGAVKTRMGKFELANSGTLLLDEITEIPIHLQSKLLRVLQENEVDRLGGRYPVQVDVRTIATTNTDVESAITANSFRKDLYYRLNVIPLKIPALRDRADDIPLLARYFMEKYSRMYGRRFTGLSRAADQKLREHSWPGNVRELENVIQRAVILGNGHELTPDCLQFDGSPQPASKTMDLMPISKMEQILIGQALEAVQGNRSKAAEILGISVRTLRNKLHEYRQGGMMSDE